ncbi:MAG: IS3 family transposase [Candidatus Gracilibacteria bacterium]|nr:IS3 family transposase [Candidatus Gracilibacteria bacterium]MDD3120418.1 IS3 family transposase [Candidatus Gracilibacteria bacterium]MDD4530516.1 IS3 family transposase [Candidatus Gracilibacteria bacterium]
MLSCKTKNEREKNDLELIKEISLKSKQKNGYRMITMMLKLKGITMNHKKVLRLMNKYNLLAKIRRKNPYKQIMKANQEHITTENKLNREFSGIGPLKKLGTDITYIRFKGKWIYLSIIKDIITAEILASKISDNLSLGIVHETLRKLKERYADGKLNEALLHSDQGFHCTHPSFGICIKELGCIQSMSRKGNCIDNSPTESFFGHLKDEIDISDCNNIQEVEKNI